jgi:hypothetical protein
LAHLEKEFAQCNRYFDDLTKSWDALGQPNTGETRIVEARRQVDVFAVIQESVIRVLEF